MITQILGVLMEAIDASDDFYVESNDGCNGITVGMNNIGFHCFVRLVDDYIRVSTYGDSQAFRIPLVDQELISHVLEAITRMN